MRRKKSFLPLIILLFLSIGFAILSSNLSIGSNIAISNASFDVHFEDATIYGTNINNLSNPVINNAGDTITMNVDLDKPGDYVTITVLVVNSGTIDAELNEILATTLTTDESQYITYTYSYFDDSSLTVGDLLRSGRKRLVKITCQYKFDVNDFIDIDEKSVSLSLKYIQPNSYNEKVWVYDYTGSYQTFTATHTGNYKIELWGAKGGTRMYCPNCGGLGAYTSGIINLTKNSILYVYVGEEGKKVLYSDSVKAVYNGGGYCEVLPKEAPFVAVGGSGAGATDIRTVSGDWNNFSSLKSRIMVAAGGGANGYSTTLGGAGGGLIGYSPAVTPHFESYSSGKGGTQTAGGSWDIYSNDLTPGGFGYGGSSTGAWDGGGSGGSGYFGGSGGKVNSGAGGSSYISGHIGCVAIEGTSTSDNITFPTKHGVLCDNGTIDKDCSIHNSGIYFTETKMIDGMGYEWKYTDGDTEVTASDLVVGMPTFDGTGTMNGNSGNGYAKITYLG